MALATFALMTNTSKKATLKHVLCIQYLVWFHQKNNKDKNKDIRTFMDLSSKINIIHSAYNKNLGFCIKKLMLAHRRSTHRFWILLKWL